MYLKELRIKNFRKISDLTIHLPKGLCILVGENNSGKTAIIDALRLVLMSGGNIDALRVSEDDFRFDSEFEPIEVNCVFTDLNGDDEVYFLECLVDMGDGKFDMQMNTRVTFNTQTRRPSPRSWGGETEGGTISSIVYDRIESVYLQPLRDPESGLRPGRRSQISRLLGCLTNLSGQQDFIEITKQANDSIRQLDPVQQATEDINRQMKHIAGEQMAQNTQLVFTEPSFHRIISGILPEVENLPFSLNGLGYNNLIYTAATLSTLQKSDNFSYRSILVEEPEAHLHPHLQTLLLTHLSNEASKNKGNNFQVIVSSHSPTLVSQAPIDSIVSIQEVEKCVRAVSICQLNIEPSTKKKLQRYLDATRGELFFARRLLIVEGIAEVLLIPILAKIAGGNLKEAAVSIVNVEGINFDMILPLIGKGKMEIPVAILTDSDPTSTKPLSASAQKLMVNDSEIENLRVSMSSVTFEHELAKNPKIRAFMLQVFSGFHRQTGAQLNESIGKAEGDIQKADIFLKQFKTSDMSKGSFAQELAELLDQSSELHKEDVPEYILEALQFLGVITE